MYFLAWGFYLNPITQVIKRIDPLDKNITLNAKEDILAAREAFDALTSSQQANISKQLKQKLLDAEAKWSALLNPASSFSLLPFHLLNGLILGVGYFLKTNKEGCFNFVRLSIIILTKQKVIRL